MSDSENTRTLRKCSFCGRSEEQVSLLFPSGDGKAYICDGCISVCADFIDEQFEEQKGGLDIEELTLDTLPRPKEIKAMLDQYVIGQDEAKLALAVAVYNHYKRILKLKEASEAHSSKKKKEEISEIDEVEIQKSNVLLLGPTGVGKTYIAQTLAKSWLEVMLSLC